eukprot:1246_1
MSIPKLRTWEWFLIVCGIFVAAFFAIKLGTHLSMNADGEPSNESEPDSSTTQTAKESEVEPVVADENENEPVRNVRMTRRNARAGQGGLGDLLSKQSNVNPAKHRVTKDAKITQESTTPLVSDQDLVRKKSESEVVQGNTVNDVNASESSKESMPGQVKTQTSSKPKVPDQVDNDKVEAQAFGMSPCGNVATFLADPKSPLKLEQRNPYDVDKKCYPIQPDTLGSCEAMCLDPTHYRAIPNSTKP